MAFRRNKWRNRTKSPFRSVSPAGKRDFAARDKRMQKICEVRSDVCRDRSIAHNSANSRRFDERQENLSSRRTVWWGWEDSNLQPIDYQSLALSIDQRPACGISWLAKCPIRALRPAISTILWQRLRGRNRYIEIQSAICRNKALLDPSDHLSHIAERFAGSVPQPLDTLRGYSARS